MNQPRNESETLLGIFLEEARDLLDAMSALVQQGSLDQDHKQWILDLKRDLHTFKGGARMINQTALSTLAHESESLCDAMLASDHPVQQPDYDLMCASQDRMNKIVECLNTKTELPAIDDLLTAFKQGVALPLEPDKPSALPITASSAQRPNDLMRVRADLLEKLNDLSIENNIMRVNLSHHMDHFKAQVAEMVRVTKSLQEKMRVLPTGTDLSMTSEIMGLLNLCKGLTQLHANVESLLTRQTRIELELQNRLVDTRMIPFSSVLPRLGRITRQVADELHKNVALKIFEVEGEMDRNLLENLISSLEHLLRNAIDHGIESPAIRAQCNKPAVGKIGLRFFRRGTEACIEISDDGSGLQTEAIRRKAIQLGFMSEKEKLSEENIIHFIFEPGFSTRETISPISGRGLGLDIVNTVVKGLGGNISIETKENSGTTFVIRMPFTTSMNRALLVMVQDQTYGIFLANVERVVLLNIKQITENLNQASPIIYFENKEYHLKYLGAALGMKDKPSLSKNKENLPVLLFNFPDYKAALLVDALSGSQEVAIQTLGPQFKLIDVFGGATLLADGRPVVMLDVYAITSKGNGKWLSTKDSKVPEKKRPVVMVVDDSITVRTVTKNFLERYHYQVVTAKDGVEALEKMECAKPAILLLDLEMPRMDGFEVVEKLRSQAVFAHMPIVMITFCVGEAQKEKAKALGIDRFIKKPYKESDLLEMIEHLLEKNKEV